MSETPQEKHARLRQAVLDWMDAEAKRGRLRQNHEAPMWDDYEEAVSACLRLPCPRPS